MISSNVRFLVSVKQLQTIRLSDIRQIRREIRKIIKNIHDLKIKIKKYNFEVIDDPETDGVIEFDHDDYGDYGGYSSDESDHDRWYYQQKQPKLNDYYPGYMSDNDDYHYMDDPKNDIDYW